MSARDFTVWLYRPPEDDHTLGLLDAARGVSYALGRLGRGGDLVVSDVTPRGRGRLVVFGAHRIPSEAMLPDDAVIYNSEQVKVAGELGRVWRESDYLWFLRAHSVWDYNQANLDALGSLGVYHGTLCRIGWHPGLDRVIPAPREDIDVLHVGSTSSRRDHVLAACAMRGLSVKSVFGTYGTDLDRVVARAKVCVNVHFYPDPVWEVFRCSYLFANRKCVVTEDGGVDLELEEMACSGAVRVPVGQIAGECARLVRDDMARREVGERGWRALKTVDLVAEVERALQETQ